MWEGMIGEDWKEKEKLSALANLFSQTNRRGKKYY
jgi:hypothetical protein